MCMGGTHDKMMGSSSDDWILLSLRLQPLLIMHSHNTNAIPHTLQMLLTLVRSVLICIRNSLIAELHYTAPVHSKSFNHMLNLRRSISSSTASFLRLSLSAICPLWTPNYTDSWYHYTLSYCLGRSTDIASKCSERTRWKHCLPQLFYCVSCHVVITQAAHWPAACYPANELSILAIENWVSSVVSCDRIA
jgi:hypothetical protein